MRGSGESFVKSLEITAPVRVLDLGCGDGTTAVPLARMGNDVTGIDISAPLVAAGNARAKEEGLSNLVFQEGDARDLAGVADDTFDLTISVFGAMFAPEPFNVAREMVRVTKPGGRIVMGNWIPNDPTSFVSQLLKIGSAYQPPPPEGFVSPVTWGVEDHIVDRFTRAGVPKDKITTGRDTFYFVSAEATPADWVDALRRYYGPTMNAYDAARQSGREDELHQKVLAEAEAQNKGANGILNIPATFMRVTVQL